MATQDVERFVRRLQEFHDSLPDDQRVMLARIVDAAEDTQGYGWKNRTEGGAIGGEGEDTQGYGWRQRTEGSAIGGEGEVSGIASSGDRWEQLVRWLSEGEDTQGFRPIGS